MKKPTPAEAKGKIQQYCAYQERSHLEVRNKLYGYGLYRTDVDEILSALITDGFLNEERFAKAFAGGKFRMKKWGRIKITHALEAKGVSPNCIKIALKEIEQADYLKSLHELLTVKAPTIGKENTYEVRDKLSKYAMQKGYEPELIWKVLREIVRIR
jgi:regulatory protein